MEAEMFPIKITSDSKLGYVLARYSCGGGGLLFITACPGLPEMSPQCCL